MSWKSGSPAERRARLSALLHERVAGGTAPLSPAQERLWFLEQLDPGQPTYHIPTLLRLDGLLDEGALERVLAELVRRHESLRTVYELDGATPRQRVLPRAVVPFEVFDLTGRGAGAEAEAVRLIAEDARRSFDLERGPLVRASLYRLEEHRRLFLLTIHHIAADGWSLVVLMRELEALYPAFTRGEQSPLKDPPLQYRDYVRWQQGALQGASLARLKSFWRAELDGAPTQTELPADFAPPAVMTHRGNIYRFDVEPAPTDALRALGRQEDATLYMGLLALYATLLHRLGAQHDLVIGSPAAHRPRVEMEGLVGLCANVLPMRLDLSGDPPFRDLLRRTREVVYRALQHQEFPFERMVEELRPSRRLGRNPIFQVLFTLQNLPRGRAASRGHSASSLPPVVGTGRAQFDVSFSANEIDGGLVCSFEYSTELFTQATGERMAHQFCTLLKAAVAEPDARLSRLPLLSGIERTQVLAAACRAAPSPQPTAPELLIAERAQTHPDDAAIVSPDETLTFARLEREVASVSRQLRELGVGTEVCVASSVTGARDAVVALLAVLRAGGTYVPVDPQLPDERAAFILASTRASILLTTPALEERWRAVGATNLLLVNRPAVEDDAGESSTVEAPAEAAAYVIFTSGSTGWPKGVVASRRGIANHIHALHSLYPLGAKDAVLQLTPIGFDASLWELLGPLSAGARLVSLPTEAHGAPSRIVEWMAREHITAIQVVPSLLRPLLDEPGLDRCRHLRRVYCGGEPLSPELARRFHSRLDAELVNLYGPTEATIDVTSWRCAVQPDGRDIPIGHPIPGACAYALDANMEPAPNGVPAELYAGGAGVARGYLNAPGETAERFVPNPFGAPGSRLYRTGDRVRLRAGGEFEFGGRFDAQIKLRGQRIELGEIEATLQRHSGVAEAAVALSAPPAGEPRLVALVVPRGSITIEELRQYLGARLPSAQVPAIIRLVDGLPTAATGKVDRRAISSVAEQLRDTPPEPPCPGEETLIAEVWCALLKLERVGRFDNFFELGGHSLLAMQVVARVRDVLGLELPLQQLFMTPTVSGLAAWAADTRSHVDTPADEDADVRR